MLDHAELRISQGSLGQIQLTHALFASMVLEYYRANPQAYADIFKWVVNGPQPTTASRLRRAVAKRISR